MPLFNKEKAINICQIAVDWLLLSLVFLLPLSFAFFHETFNIFILYKVVILRVFVSLAALFFLAKIFLAGKLEYRFSNYFLAGIFLLVCSWLFSSFFSDIWSFGFWGHYNRQQGFFTLIFYLLFFLLLIFNLKDIAKAKRFIKVFLFSSFFACFYGVVQYFSFDPINWAETDRIFSSLGQPNLFGHFLILAIPFSVYALFFLARRFLTRFLLITLLFGQIFCLFLTYSRSAWVGLVFEIILAALIFLFLSGRKKIAIGLITFFAAGLVAVCLLFSFYSRPVVKDYTFISRLQTIFNFNQGSVKVRLNIWQAAIEEFRQESTFRKLFGYGPDSLFEPFAKHYRANWALDETINIWPDRAHNLFLDIVLSFGLVGLAIYLLFFGYLLFRVKGFFKAAPKDENLWLAVACLAALAGYFFNNLFSFSDTPQYLCFYLILGLLIFLLSRNEENKELRIKLSVFSRILIYISFLALIAIFIFYFNLRLVLADFYFMRTTLKINNNSCPEALDYNRKAIAWGGGNSLFYQGEYLTNGLNCIKRLPPGEARESLKNNLLFYSSSLPGEKYFFFAKYKIDVDIMVADNFDQTYYSRVEKEYSDLAEKYPTIPLVYRDWADFELGRDNYDEAIKIADDGLKTLPLKEMESRGSFSHRSVIEGQLNILYDILGTAYAQKKEFGPALDYYEKIIKVNPYDLIIYKKIANIYYQKKDLDRALWYNERGYRLNPDDPAWPLAIGILYKEKGDNEWALDYFEEVLVLSPDNSDAKKFISDLKK